jgi:hypothetical protein
MTPLPNAKDDAYRLYNIGVAYEALAYQTEDRKAAKGFLQDAAINYGKAVDAKRDEKYFLEPQKRIETAMAYYRKIEGQSKAVAAANAPAEEPSVSDAGKSKGGATKPSGSKTKKATTGKGPADPKSTGSNSKADSTASADGGKTATAPATPALTNDQIIKMAKAGVDEDSIIATIRDAATVKFDLTPDGQIGLTSGGVKPKVLAAMRDRAKRGNRRAPAGG